MADTKDKGKKVKPNEPTEILWMANEFKAQDEKDTVHKALAEKLVASKKAYYPGTKRPEVKEDKK